MVFFCSLASAFFILSRSSFFLTCEYIPIGADKAPFQMLCGKVFPVFLLDDYGFMLIA